MIPLTHEELSRLCGEYLAAAEYAREAALWYAGPGANTEGAATYRHLLAALNVARQTLFATASGEMAKLLEGN